MYPPLEEDPTIVLSEAVLIVMYPPLEEDNAGVTGWIEDEDEDDWVDIVM
jgi:hypothetical protein